MINLVIYTNNRVRNQVLLKVIFINSMSVQRTILSNSTVSIPSSNQSEETQLQSSVSSEVSHPRVHPPTRQVCVIPASVAKTSSSESSSQSSVAVLESSSKHVVDTDLTSSSNQSSVEHLESSNEQDVERDVELTSRANPDFSSEERNVTVDSADEQSSVAASFP